MTEDRKNKGADLFIVDNSDKAWKVKNYLHDWTEIAHQFDIATGFFEIGALLTLDGQWQKLNKLRILMGDAVSKRTKKALLAGVEVAKNILDNSIEKEKENNDFLTGVPAIADAIKKKQIECCIYTKEKFHAKAYKLARQFLQSLSQMSIERRLWIIEPGRIRIHQQTEDED